MRWTSPALLLAAAASASAAPIMKVNPATGMIVDGQGRSRIFHGVNAVEKLPPFIVDYENCNRDQSLCPEDMDKLAGWGMNVIRLGVLWRGVVPEHRGGVNQTYLAQVRKVVDALEAKGIYTIIDMHQDVLHPRTCGEGMPDWAYFLAMDSVGHNYNSSFNKFPHPLPFKIEDDPATGLPNLTQCQSHSFAEYYLSFESMAVWKALYTRPEVWEALGEHYAAVAGALADSSGVIGYELLNEPWVTSTNRSLLSLSDKASLLGLYKACAKAIRSKDTQHIIMFEPLVLISYEEIVGVTTDFPEYGIEGKEFADREIFAYHSYCSNNAQGTPSPMWLCKLIVDSAWKGVTRNLAHLKLGGFLTEFGAAANDDDSAKLLKMQTDGADAQLQSWAYWTYRSYDDITTQNKATETFYNVDGSLQLKKIKALSRTYAHAIAGEPKSMSFDTDSGAFSLVYVAPAEPTAAATDVFVSPFYYTNGTKYTVSIAPAGAATWAKDASRPGHITVTHTSAAASQTLTVKVTA
eukprot:TRINITY_DN206_c0_g2_i1.p2 TRINITY_DN206_c0_g2~~TRINITY_DN206_c0_g2_i1.p2  ORF type:complete len:521 (+),score=188.76 TRINITY_DN206_c0_g2_i1:65-1627(+)